MLNAGWEELVLIKVTVYVPYLFEKKSQKKSKSKMFSAESFRFEEK